MEKQKSKKIKKLQITYPTPYSQSWNTDVAPVLMRNSVGRTTNGKRPVLKDNRRVESRRVWSQSYSHVRGPDPTAPHLKYGVFPNKRISSSRGQPKSFPIKSMHTPQLNVIQATPVKIQRTKSLAPPVRKRTVKKSLRSQSPVFIYRSIDKRFTRQLSLSETMHIDIKPKRIMAMSASFHLSPNFKAINPRLTLPNKEGNR